MIRKLLIAVVAAVLAVLPMTAFAAPAGYYVATPLAAPTKTTVITDGIVWKWSETAFVAQAGTQRAAIACQMIAQRTGKLSSFTVAGTALDADAMAKCNARAR